MKIIVQGYLGKYSSMGQWVVDGLRFLGHDVVDIDRNAEVVETDADLHFIVDCSEDFSAHIKDNGIKKVCWLMDTQMPGGLERSLNIAHKCDYVFSSNREYGVNLLQSYGVQSILMPITYNDLNMYQRTKIYDVTMIGHANSNERIQLWEMLKGYSGYRGSTDNLKEFNKYMGKSKIVVNQPTEPFDNILNNRFFEGLAYNTLLLQKRLHTSLIEDLGFVAGQDFLYWDTLDQVVPMIDAVLWNYEDFLPIVKSGNEKVKKFRLTNQLKQIIEYVSTKN